MAQNWARGYIQRAQGNHGAPLGRDCARQVVVAQIAVQREKHAAGGGSERHDRALRQTDRVGSGADMGDAQKYGGSHPLQARQSCPRESRQGAVEMVGIQADLSQR